MVVSGSCSFLLFQAHLWGPGGALDPVDSGQALLVLKALSSLSEATFLSTCGLRVWPCPEVKRRHRFLFHVSSAVGSAARLLMSPHPVEL